uniref:Uncharacterized protein n=1 Tax=Rhizophora mucronata TaxID=61149 RepID=A0A2P2Q0Q5_RHIMU
MKRIHHTNQIYFSLKTFHLIVCCSGKIPISVSLTNEHLSYP